MVSLGPDTQSTNFSHMYSFVDYSNSKRPELCTAKNTLYEYIRTRPNMKRFNQILEKAHMQSQMNEDQANRTLFIPTDDYLVHIAPDFFNKMDDGLARQILDASSLRRRINKDILTSSPVCYYTTFNPEMRMYCTNINEITRLNNCVKVIRFDILLDNGTIHIVDGLLAPSSDHFMN